MRSEQGTDDLSPAELEGLGSSEIDFKKNRRNELTSSYPSWLAPYQSEDIGWFAAGFSNYYKRVKNALTRVFCNN